MSKLIFIAKRTNSCQLTMNCFESGIEYSIESGIEYATCEWCGEEELVLTNPPEQYRDHCDAYIDLEVLLPRICIDCYDLEFYHGQKD